MNDPQSSDLDPFEAALLTHLKAVVAAEQPQPASPTPSPLVPHRRRRWQLMVIAAAAAVAAVVVLLVPGSGTTPAYAVTGRNDGQVHVKVTRLEGSDGLEGALSAHGIASDVIYLPPHKQCAPGRYAERRTPGLTLAVGADLFEVTIPPGTVGREDTFVLSASVVPTPDGASFTVEFGIAEGPVAACRVVDAP